ncbi:MAG: hypothetical protein IJX37_10145 [Oscillospiraceae bacterium]|nr:hypothetical protein [Oscillospiraceae bacterium]
MLVALTPQVNNMITLALVAVLALVVIIAVIRKAVAKSKAAKAEAAVPVEVEEIPAPTAPGSAGQLKLHNVDPKIAAMLMAIVADKLQKPLNELRFISIKEVE